MVCPRSHAQSDFISLELSKLAAQRIREQPQIVAKGLERIDRWIGRPGYDEGWTMSLQEWKRIILSCDAEQVAQILEMENQEGQRLRSSMPFIRPPFFSEEERLGVIERAF